MNTATQKTAQRHVAPNLKAAATPAAAPQHDQRPGTTVQHQLLAGISNSPQVQQATTLQRAINNSLRQQAAPTPVQRKANKTGLPDQLKAGTESLSGHSLDDVRVHYNSDKPAQMQAHAYAQGSDIHVAPGQEKHLPHEAWHVVQQKQGRVRATKQLKGRVAVNDDAGLEKEADMMGFQATKITQRQASGQGHVASRLNITPVIQKNDKDPVEKAVLDVDSEALKVDFDAAMSKIKSAMMERAAESKKLAQALQRSGRDWLVYAPLLSWFNGVGGLLQKWSKEWSIEDSAALLVDLGTTIGKLIPMEGVAIEVMNKEMAASRQENKRINKQSEWAKNLPLGARTQAGASASTGAVLKMLWGLNVTSKIENEAILNGLILFWKNSKIKQFLGQYHTAAEVWSVYNYMLMEYMKTLSETNSGQIRAKL